MSKEGAPSPDSLFDLRPEERLDDLERNGFKLIQKPSAFCFGMDAVLLSGFARVKKGERALDLCSGNGIVAILLAAKSESSRIDALELQPQMAEMACRSVKGNGLSDRVFMECGDVRDAVQKYGKAVFDVITCNPPYIRAGHGLVNPTDGKAIARHEICCTFEDVARQSAQLLKPGGRLYLVHRPERLMELLSTLQKANLEPKRMKMVHQFLGEPANMVLLEAVRGGGSAMQVEAPVIVYRAKGEYTDEIREIYGY